MDISRDRFRTSSSQQPIDGFYFKPSQSMHPRPANGVQRRPAHPQHSPGVTGNRQIGDFRRPDGFYTAPRRQMTAGGTAAAPTIRSGTALPQHVAAPNHFEQNLGRKGRGRHGRNAHRHQRHHRGKFRTFGRWAFRGTAVSMLLLLIVGGFLIGKGYLKARKVFDGSSSAAALQANVDPTKLKGEGDGRVNILLLGIGGSTHKGGDLTDTIMIASVDPVNNQAVLFSVPRDLWVKMPNNYFNSYQKINAAYSSGKYKYLGKTDPSNQDRKAIQAGFDAVDGTIERVMGVPIHYNALVNFQAFKHAVDTVGGITVDAPEQLYDPTMAWENGWSPVLAQKGINNFDGKKALNYVRSRQTSSDFARSQRQRAVMLAIRDKVLSAGTLSNPVKISGLLSAFGNNVQTDVGLTDMQRMAVVGKKIPANQIQSVGLTEGENNFLTTGNINGISVVQPRAGLEDYSAIQTYVRQKLKDGYISQENANVTVLNGTVVPGLATEKADELKSYGYAVGTVDNAPTPDFDTTRIIDLSKGSKKYTINYLKKRYRVQSTSATLPAGIVQGNADIVIILGQDAATLTQN